MTGRLSVPRVAGIDVGSVASKAVVYSPAERKVEGWALVPTGRTPGGAGLAAFEAACSEASVRKEEVRAVVGTGYGRVALPFVHKTVTEISCHAVAAVHVFPSAGVVVDIGGQDSKVISVEADGAVADFVMNDKCAAGTGRFLEVIAGILDMPLDEFGKAAGEGEPAPISGMCAVFAESEIVGLLAGGAKPQDLAAGVFLSVARRIRALAGRIPMRGQCVFTGGLAASPAFGRMLSSELGVRVDVPERPQHMGALGAALIAAAFVGEKSYTRLTPLPQNHRSTP
jgi:predicted CoA-substrate-specific enzyme activase